MSNDELDVQRYREVVGRHPAGVTVVTLQGTDRPVGFTASSVVSVSSTPPVLAFCVSERSGSWPALAVAASVVVNLLAVDQVALAERFSERGVDRFADGSAWSRLPTGDPVLRGTRGWIRGEILERVSLGGSHLIAVRALTHGADRPDAAPLVYRDGTYHHLAENA